MEKNGGELGSMGEIGKGEISECRVQGCSQTLKRGVSKRKLAARNFGATPTSGDTPFLFGSYLLSCQMYKNVRLLSLMHAAIYLAIIIASIQQTTKGK